MDEVRHLEWTDALTAIYAASKWVDTHDTTHTSKHDQVSAAIADLLASNWGIDLNDCVQIHSFIAGVVVFAEYLRDVTFSTGDGEPEAWEEVRTELIGGYVQIVATLLSKIPRVVVEGARNLTIEGEGQ